MSRRGHTCRTHGPRHSPLWQNWGASAMHSCSAGAVLLGLLLMGWKLRMAKQGGLA